MACTEVILGVILVNQRGGQLRLLASSTAPTQLVGLEPLPSFPSSMEAGYLQQGT